METPNKFIYNTINTKTVYKLNKCKKVNNTQTIFNPLNNQTTNQDSNTKQPEPTRRIR